MNRFGDIDASFKRLPPVYGYHAAKLVSIEQALEPVESEIEELPRFIKIAKQHCHFPSEHGLSRDQSAAIYIYTMEWGDTTLYRVLNRALRSENREALKIWFPYLKLFDTALDKLPTVKEAIWRGVPLDIGNNFTKGQIVTWWSVNSCTLSVEVIKTFLGRQKDSTLFLIEAISGKNVAGYTGFENEEEIILRMGCQFRVKSNPLKQENGSCLVHLIEIDDDNGQSSASSMRGAEVGEPLYSGVSLIPDIPTNVRWSQNGQTVAGGNGRGNATDQLNLPFGLFVDDDETIIIADFQNHRIVQWKKDYVDGQVVAGGNGEGTQFDQLTQPVDILVDKGNDTLLICDKGNRRIVRWSRRSGTTQGEVIIDHIDCYGLAIDDQRNIYVSDIHKHEVRRYQQGEKKGVLVAGGNGKGIGLNQLNYPTYIFVDRQQTVYVSDNKNHRVMKWKQGAREGVVIAGGQGQGDAVTQLSFPHKLFVDISGNLYVTDLKNNRVMRWLRGAMQGTVVVGGNGEGKGMNQLSSPFGLFFDRHGNIYVADSSNHRVQRFSIRKI